jgi:cytochrome c553
LALAELEAKLEELRALGDRDGAVAISEDVTRLEAKAAAALAELYATTASSSPNTRSPASGWNSSIRPAQ